MVMHRTCAVHLREDWRTAHRRTQCRRHFLVLPTRCAVANIFATVSRFFGCTFPAGMRMWVRSSSFSSRSTSAIESIKPEETSGVFSSIENPGFRISCMMWPIICWTSGVMRRSLLRLSVEFGMFSQQFLASGGARRLSGGTLYDPLGRFQENRTHGHSETGDDPAAYFLFDFEYAHEKLFALQFCNCHDVLSTEVGIVHAHGDDPAVMNRRVAGDDLFDVLGINVLPADDEKVFLPSDHVKLAVERETKISRAVPTAVDRERGKVGAVIVAGKQAITLDEDLADLRVGQSVARVRHMRTS